MNINKNETGFDLLKRDSEDDNLKHDHLALFEDRLGNLPKSNKKINWFSIPIAAVLVVGLLLTGFLTFNSSSQNPDLSEYQTTKSYFATYIEYEIGKQHEKITKDNKQIIESRLKEVTRLQKDYINIETEFFANHYDKQILKRMIENFRQQLDILENIDSILEETLSNQPNQQHQNENNTI